MKLASLGLLLANVASAQAPLSDRAPYVEGDAVVVAAVGIPDARIEREDAAIRSARTRGEARAREMLRAYVERFLSRTQARPAQWARLWIALDRAELRAVRPLADRSAVVVMAIPLRALRAACAIRGAPWSD